MDDKQNSQQTQTDRTQQQPQGVVAGQPVNPISGPHKEVAPLSGQTSEYVKPVESAPELPKEVEAAGVEAVEDRPQIHPEAAKAGLTHAKEHVSHPTEPAGVVTYPLINQQQATVMQKKSSVRDAARWLAVFVLRQFDKIAYQKLPTK